MFTMPAPMNHLEACVALNMIPQMGPVRQRRLLDAFGSAEKTLLARADQLAAVEGIPRPLAENIARWQEFADPATELKKAADLDARVITSQDDEYLPLLREIHDPPIVLYVRGQITERDRNAVAVVGSRKATHYATECAKKLGFQMAYAGLTVVSGLARGIDTAAHQGALAAKGRTIAVIGAGLAHLYPPENAELAERIAASGAVISEFPIDTKPDRQTFPIRNRIVTGMSFGVLVVEAGANSGALISANMAAEQGRTLYAVPGRIDSPPPSVRTGSSSRARNSSPGRTTSSTTCRSSSATGPSCLHRWCPSTSPPIRPKSWRSSATRKLLLILLSRQAG